MNRRITGSLWCVLLLLSVSGCGLTAAQRDAASKFAAAATKFGDASSTELQKMKDQTVAMNEALYRIPDVPGISGVGANLQTCSPPEQNCGFQHLADGYSETKYTDVLRGSQKLKTYGTTLTAILKANNSDEVNKATDSVGATLKDLPKVVPGTSLGDAASTAVTKAFQFFEKLYLDRIKARAIRKAEGVMAQNNAVPIICGYIGNEFDAAANNGEPTTFGARFASTAGNLMKVSAVAIKSNPRDRLIRSDGVSTYQLGQQNLEETRTTFLAIRKSADACIKADAAFQLALQNNSFSLEDIENFFSAAQEASSNAKSAKQ